MTQDRCDKFAHPAVFLAAYHEADLGCRRWFKSSKTECGRGDRYCEMVQRDQGIWIHSPDSGGKDVFVHISAVEKAGLSSLNEGAKVGYEEMINRGKTSAENLRVG